MLNNKNFRLFRYIVPPLWNYSAAEMVRFTVTSFFDIAVIVKQPHSDNTPYEKIGDEVRSLVDEVPFDIPDSWEWVRLGSIVYNRGQITPSKDFCYIDIGSIDNKNQKLNPTDTVIAPDKAPSRARKLVAKGDVLYSTVRPYLHNMCIVDRNFSCIPIASTGFAVLTCHAELCNKFLFYYMMSPDFDAYANNTDNAKGVAYPAINDDRLYKALIPIPPLGEQFRIVSAIESVDASIRDYGAKEEALRTLNGSFPEALKKSILQEAVQGKLVPQDPSDEPAEALLERIRAEKQRLIKEGKIKKDKHESVIFRRDNSHYEKLDGVERCIDDELPFDIPESWIWVRLIDICEYIQRGKSPKYSPIKKYPVIAQKCNQWSGFSIEKAQFIEPESIASYGNERFLQDNDLMWNSTGLGTLGRMAVYKSALNPYKLAVADSHVTVIRPLKEIISPQYLYFYFSNPTVQSVIEDQADGTTKQKELSATTVKAYFVPLPPYNEQLRIVNQIEAVLPLVAQA